MSKRIKITIDCEVNDQLYQAWNNIGVGLRPSEKLKILLNKEIKNG